MRLAASTRPTSIAIPRALIRWSSSHTACSVIEDGYPVVDARGYKIGAFIGLSSDRYAAWSRGGKIGEFATLGQAESAVRAADRTRLPRK
jgi:hypothetical protein